MENVSHGGREGKMGPNDLGKGKGVKYPSVGPDSKKSFFSRSRALRLDAMTFTL